MTATNHVITGAVIAIVIKSPVLAIVLAIVSHFALDALPHFGIHEDDVLKRNEHWLFRRIVTIDTALTIVALVLLPILLRNIVFPWVTVMVMIAALVPDLLWIPHFMHEIKHKVVRRRSRFLQFHQNIQWSETPEGLLVEIVWAGSAVAALVALA